MATKHQDLHGLTLSTDSEEAAAAFDRATTSYLKYRTDAGRQLGGALKADPDFALAHVLRGYFNMLAYNQANVAGAQESLAEARKRAKRTTTREAAHIEALATWVEGDLDRMLDVWEGIFAEHPHDVLAFRLHHFNAFWLGRPEEMQVEVERVFPHWRSDQPGWGMVLSCRCFAHEEAGNYTLAEAAGRQAIEVDPGDLWGAHAIAHVLEMQGRRGEGIGWLKKLEPHWEGANNLKHHLYWHRAMFHIERREFPEVLALYDNGFRDLNSPLTQAMPDMYIDVQNAASMLFRLERHGIDVGDRWVELADKAEARVGDCLSGFTLPHWMMALAATGRFEAAARMLDAMRAFGQGNGTVQRLVARVALPICQAVLAHRQGKHEAALAVLRPVISEMYLLGGSHAQQDVLEQLFLDCALKADSPEDVRLMLERVAGRHPVPPGRRIGYAMAADRFSH
ncbi:MAG: tetratricopeptide repeat protein [Enhydrobacter sp.]|nr:MAG: tetratricopeptide repeat protein [Enhydrobacter sp.]